jgi:hypothetical protein
VTESNPTPWAESFDALWAAESLSEAQIAAAHLVSVVVPGGSAVDLSTRPLIARIRERARPLATHPHRAYMVAVLLAMGTWIGAWRRAASTNPRLAAAAEREQTISMELSEFCRENLGLLIDADPETRSVMSLLVGTAWPLTADDVLLDRFAAESDPRVKACIAQAMVRYVGRLDERRAADLGRDVSALLNEASTESLARANLELTAVWWTEGDRKRLAGRVSIPEMRDRPLLWPSEEISVG